MTQTRGWQGLRIYTVGHSTRSLDELVALLRSFEISTVADIRTIPRSRHNPQFNRDALPSALAAHGLGYVHLPRLGGLRRARKDSPNTGWRNASFRGFADYMLGDEFEAGLTELRALAKEGRVAVMCAEAVPWRCHRSLIADALTARGAQVEHIARPSHSTPHRMSQLARVEDWRVTYPGEGEREEELPAAAPFHLEATVGLLQRRRGNLVNVWHRESYWRALVTRDGIVLVQVHNRGTIDHPDLRLSLCPSQISRASKAEVTQAIRRLLGLDTDPGSLQRLGRVDRALLPTVRALRGMRPPRFVGLFETFGSIVPFQQVSLESGLATLGRIVRRFGQPYDWQDVRCYAFPPAEAIAQASARSLRECGLSQKKAESLQRLAAMVLSAEVSEEVLSTMSTHDALAVLEQLPGIGPWSAALVLLRGLGRMDVFPPGDSGAKRSLDALFPTQTEPQLRATVERAGDQRGYLYFCALGSSLLEKELIHPAPLSKAERRRHTGP